MGFLAPAMPWIVKGGAALAGGMLGKSRQDAAMKRSPEEQAALGGAQGSASQLAGAGSGLYARAGDLVGQGAPYMKQAGDYWSTLLGGNRAAMSLATAAPRAAITDQFRGAESNLQRSGVRGGAADVAKAELSRDRVNQIAQLTAGVQPAAATQLGQLGGQTVGLGTSLAGVGTSAMANAGNLYGNLLGEGFEARKYGRQEGAEASQQIGGLLADIFGHMDWKKFMGMFKGRAAGPAGR